MSHKYTSSFSYKVSNENLPAFLSAGKYNEYLFYGFLQKFKSWILDNEIPDTYLQISGVSKKRDLILINKLKKTIHFLLPIPQNKFLIFNDPSAGSPTETLLRLHLPLNDEVKKSCEV